MSGAPTYPGQPATHEDIVRLEARIGRVEERLARLEEHVTIGLASVTRMLNWIFMLQVAMTVGFMGAMVAFIALWFQINT